MHERSQLVRPSDDLCHGLHRPDLVVSEPDRDQRGTAGNGIRVRPRRTVDPGDLDGVTLGLEAPDCTEHRLVLGRPRHDDAALGKAASHAEQCQVDGLGSR
jgi:hypothetical protein